MYNIGLLSGRLLNVKAGGANLTFGKETSLYEPIFQSCQAGDRQVKSAPGRKRKLQELSR